MLTRTITLYGPNGRIATWTDCTNVQEVPSGVHFTSAGKQIILRKGVEHTLVIEASL